MEQFPSFFSKVLVEESTIWPKANTTIAQYLIFCGFRVSNSDYGLFIKFESNVQLLPLLYDMIITKDNELKISNLRNNLVVTLKMKNVVENLVEVERSDQGYFVSLKKHANNLLEFFSMGKLKEKATLISGTKSQVEEK